MTDQQILKRWIFRYDFLEYWLSIMMTKSIKVTKEKAVKIIRKECEKELLIHGFKYPLQENEK